MTYCFSHHGNVMQTCAESKAKLRNRLGLCAVIGCKNEVSRWSATCEELRLCEDCETKQRRTFEWLQELREVLPVDCG